MQDDVGQAGETFQTERLVEIGQNGSGAVVAPVGRLSRVAQHGEHLEAAKQMRQGATRDIAAADDQEPPLWRFLLFFHCAILPESSLQGV